MLAAVASPVIIQIMRFPRAGTSCASDETARMIVSRGARGSMNKSLALALSALLLAAATAVAQEWPTKTVRIIVPFGPGSTPDMVGRLIGDRMQQKLGQPFVIENRPGASANTGTDMVAKADPDGYTVGISLGGPLAINTLLFARMPYDPVKDIALITIPTTQPSV